MNTIAAKQLHGWCRIPASDLEKHPARKVPFRIAADSAAMGALMARELADLIAGNNAKNLPTRAIIPCGPACWYKPFAEVVNREQISLRDLTVFHMDECLDWQGRELPRNHPYSFRGFMEREFYGPINPALLTPEENRWWPNATNFQEIATRSSTRRPPRPQFLRVGQRTNPDRRIFHHTGRRTGDVKDQQPHHRRRTEIPQNHTRPTLPPQACARTHSAAA